jgi:hypothetical protein
VKRCALVFRIPFDHELSYTAQAADVDVVVVIDIMEGKVHKNMVAKDCVEDDLPA